MVINCGRTLRAVRVDSVIASDYGVVVLNCPDSDYKRIVAGRSNKEISSDLHISEATVKTHINSLLSKLGVNDRTQAATTALQRGIVHLD